MSKKTTQREQMLRRAIKRLKNSRRWFELPLLQELKNKLREQR